MKRGPLCRQRYSSEMQCRELGLWGEKPRKGDLGSNPDASTHCFSGLRKLLNPTEGKQCCVHRLFSELNEDMDVETLHIPAHSSLSIRVSFLFPEQDSGSSLTLTSARISFSGWYCIPQLLGLKLGVCPQNCPLEGWPLLNPRGCSMTDSYEDSQ